MPTKKPILIIKTGSTVPSVRAARGDFEDWIASGLGLDLGALEVASVFEGDTLPRFSQLSGAVVTGSSSMVTARESWSEASAAWLASAAEASLPILGICYGHQLLAHALGGEVGPNPLGRQIGSIDVSFDARGDALLGDLSRTGTATCFQATHQESVLRLPRAALRLAQSAGDPNHAYRVGAKAWGVQFHPEFDAEIMRGYLRERREVLAAEGIEAEALIESTRESPQGPRLLRRFAREVVGVPFS